MEMSTDVEMIEANDADAGEQQEQAVNEGPVESLRVKLSVPSNLTFAQVKKLITTRLGEIQFRKLKTASGLAFFSLHSIEDSLKAVELLDKFEYRGKLLSAKSINEDPRARAEQNNADENELPKNVNEISAPLYNVPYEQQIEMKYEDAKKITQTLLKELSRANVPNIRQVKAGNLLQQVVQSPIIKHYRNKCEFSCGLTVDSEICVGFVGGRMAKRFCPIVPANDSVLITENMRKICEVFTEEIVKKSDLDVFDEFQRTGFWKRLTVRDFSGDCMIIITVHPFADEEKIKECKQKILDTFLKFGNLTDQFEFSVRSVYWGVNENVSDPIVYEHIGGAPFVYESILNVRFRVSPHTFFQSNSRGAAQLYTIIGDFLGLPNVDRSTNLQNDEQENNGQISNLSKSIYLLDICCGAGTIGQCLSRRIEYAMQAGKFNGSYACIGVEIVDQAVQDAKRNAEENGFNKQKCRYVSGDAESVFRQLNNYFNIDPNDENLSYLGVLDPPRAGLSTKVILSCRKLEKMRKLVYVSCDPKLALNNLVSLCRPESKKYEGTPFTIDKICPVDMFPQTRHCEWVVLLTR